MSKFNYNGSPVRITPDLTYQVLATQERLSLTALPRTHGIYALYDHAGVMRYIGITKQDRLGFYGRINSRHVTGSESRSHKFSHAYNTGRMWRAKGDEGLDAKIAKALRAAFARRYCRAAVMPVIASQHDLLRQLEAAVQALAPSGQLTWGDERGFLPFDEPTALVDKLISEMHLTGDQLAALGRQAARHSALVVKT